MCLNVNSKQQSPMLILNKLIYRILLKLHGRCDEYKLGAVYMYGGQDSH